MNTNNTLPDLSISITLSSAIDIDVDKFFDLDRYLGEPLILPYTYEDIKIKPNELCTADNINASLYKLHYNFLYLNAQTKIASNNFPLSGNYKGYFATEPTGDVRWFKSITGTPSRATEEFVRQHPPHTTAQITNLSADTIANNLSVSNPIEGLVDGAFADNLKNENYYMGFMATSAKLMAVQSNKKDTFIWGPSTILNTALVENSTQLSFSNIKSVAMDLDNRLFVLDDVTVFKFDVDTLLSYNPALSSIGRDLMISIGGKSDSVDDKSKFNVPISIRIGKDNKVYVLDRGDSAYRVYDKDLNWIRTANKKIDFSQDTVVDLGVDKDTEDVYVLTEGGIIFQYDKTDKLVQRIELLDNLARPYINVPALSSITVDVLGLPAQKFKKITFSRNDGDIMYVLTDKNIYKKFKTKTNRSIGSFRLNDNSIYTLSATNSFEETFEFINILNTSDRSRDYIFVGSNSTGLKPNVGKVFKFEEQVSYQTIVYDDYKTRTYPMSSVNIQPDEYVTAWVVNKALYKLLYNHLLFRDNIHSKFTGTYDSAGLVQYAGIEYITDLDDNLFGYETTLNNFIGLNEPVLAEVVNRCLHNTHVLQSSLTKMCGARITNKYPYGTQIVRLQ